MLSGDFILRSSLAGKPYFARGHTEEYLLPAQKERNQVARAALLRNVRMSICYCHPYTRLRSSRDHLSSFHLHRSVSVS